MQITELLEYRKMQAQAAERNNRIERVIGPPPGCKARVALERPTERLFYPCGRGGDCAACPGKAGPTRCVCPHHEAE